MDVFSTQLGAAWSVETIPTELAGSFVFVLGPSVHFCLPALFLQGCACGLSLG